MRRPSRKWMSEHGISTNGRNSRHNAIKMIFDENIRIPCNLMYCLLFGASSAGLSLGVFRDLSFPKHALSLSLSLTHIVVFLPLQPALRAMAPVYHPTFPVTIMCRLGSSLPPLIQFAHPSDWLHLNTKKFTSIQYKKVPPLNVPCR